MGLLDQAIREHLELKRQHGADPGELARLEREALGPPVRETQEVLATAAGPAEGAVRQATTAEPESEPWPEEPDLEAVESQTAPFDVEQAMADKGEGGATPSAPAEVPSPDDPAHAAAPHAEAELTAMPEEPDAGVAETPAPPAEPTEPPLAEPTDPTVAEPTEPTVAEPIEPAVAEPDEPAAPEVVPEPEPPAHEDSPAPDPEGEGDEDVLEETPEFLQETPEHDRLWFEQKPPRDFDFDG